MPTSSSSSESADDRGLVRRFVRTRDEAAFRALYRAHAPSLYGLALRLVRGNEATAQDIVQEAWLRVVPRLGQFRWQSKLRTWLCAVVVNVHREELRRRARETERVAAARRGLNVVRGSGSVGSSDLERAIAELPDGYREVLVLHDVEGYTHKEIASMLGIEEGTSKSQLSRARRAMRTWLDTEGASFHAK